MKMKLETRREILIDFFKPDIETTEKLLNWNCDNWKK